MIFTESKVGEKMATGLEAGKDVRIARLLARRGAPGSFAYAVFTVLVAGLTGLWKLELGLVVVAIAVIGPWLWI